jgi:hypothetical protein
MVYAQQDKFGCNTDFLKVPLPDDFQQVRWLQKQMLFYLLS